MFCKCKKPKINIVKFDKSTWGLEKNESFKECLKCIKIIESVG
jgi:hypothetical protein